MRSLLMSHRAQEMKDVIEGMWSSLGYEDIDELSFDEFRVVVRNYGFSGDARRLFKTLDQFHERRLRLKDLAFLDGWELPPAPGEEIDEGRGPVGHCTLGGEIVETLQP